MVFKYVILGDMVSSRDIKNISEVSEKLSAALNFVNDRYKLSLFTEIKIQKGIDEIGCVTNDLTSLYDIITSITEIIHPNSMRFSIGYGDVEFSNDFMDISGFTGRAFVIASNNMGILKETGFLFRIGGVKRPYHRYEGIINDLIAGQINLLLTIKRTWTINQMAIVRTYRIYHKQKLVADIHGITQQAVSKVLSQIGFDQIERIEKRLGMDLTILSEMKHWRNKK